MERLGGAVGEAGGRAVDHVDAGLDGLRHGHVSHAGGAVGVQDEGNIADGVLDALDEVLGLVRAHGAGHILQADGVEAHVLELLAHLDIFFRPCGPGSGCRRYSRRRRCSWSRISW